MLLETRPFRPFKSSEEYLYAMKEDLAEWLQTLYPELNINVDNFMDRLETGVALCKVRLFIFILSCIYAVNKGQLSASNTQFLIIPYSLQK